MEYYFLYVKHGVTYCTLMIEPIFYIVSLYSIVYIIYLIMRKGCVSQDRETNWFSVIHSLRFYPYMETTGFMCVYYKNFVSKGSHRFFWFYLLVFSGREITWFQALSHMLTTGCLVYIIFLILLREGSR